MNVRLNVSPGANFSKLMDPATLNTTTFTLMQGATLIPAVVSGAGSGVTLNPNANLAPNTVHTATITTGVKTVLGTPMAASFSWTFTTEPLPTVLSTNPAANAINVPINVSATATFSAAMDPATLNGTTFTLRQGATNVPAVVTSSGATATINPTVNLLPNTVYTATLTTGAATIGGAALATNFVWTFTTGTNAVAPVVLSTCPNNGATNVPINTRICAVFNKAMDPLTLTGTTFTVMQGLAPVIGVVSYDAATFTANFIPASPLGLNLPYTAAITTGAQDTAGTPLAMSHVWTWNTPACSQLPITLNSAGNFSVLAGSTITNTGPTSVIGDMGISPGTALTGFPPGILIGNLFAGTPVSAQGVADLTTAYNEAAGRVLCPVSVAGNLGGMTLAPGLYKSTSSLSISAGNLTLDAQGNPAAVFIFQMASTLSTTAGRQVILIGGAQAKNVFWQVGTSATFGSTTAFVGTVMADQAITFETGATLEGRALARIAGVSFDSNAVVLP